MTTPVFIGDEVTAAGYRLAGLLVRSPQREQLQEELQWARQHAPLVMITAQFAGWLAASELQALLAADDPPLVIVPDCRQQVAVPDLGIELRAQLGVME